MMKEESEYESPTDFLMRVLGDLSDDEATKVVCIFTTQSGALQISTNKLARTYTIGMLVEAQQLILNDWLLNKKEP